MKLFKKLSALILSVLFVLTTLLPIHTTLAAESDPVYDRIIERGELIVGLSADYAPYEFHTDVDGKDTIVGFDVSIAEKIAEDLGVKLKIEELGFDALLGALKTDKIDLIISGMAPTPERLKEVDFSNPYMNVQQRVIVRKDDQDKFHSTKDFSGIKVGVQKQTTQEDLAKNELIGSTPTSLQKVPDIVMNLKNKKVDAIILEGPVAEAYVDRNEDLVFADVSFVEGEKQTAIAMAKNTPTLMENVNATIQTINDENLLEGYKKDAAELMFDDNEGFLQKYGKFYLNGAGYTIFLAFIGVLFGTIFGGLLALMKLSKSKILRALAIIYIEYVRGTPLLVQIFIVYFGTGVLGLDLSKVAAGCIALTLNSGAYVAEIVRAGINAVNKGQMEASRSLGMSQSQAMRFIILPQAIKNILPALGNEFVTVIKESSVVSVIGVSELIFQAGNVQGASFKPFLPYLVVSLIYFVLTFTISRLLGVAERRMSTSD
ncbi:ABC transporter substrate-binding protein/permease [Candidatus Enterococcus clewellii]|uniref:Amino acid ABC transporter amino acid-binding/permease n=1 Tax=Candidatus Enterococcus clewellii TaxID=1834193 RepID=A0A242K3Y1_9ENTE|nr:ABC transporter substrate-binding protein/permease [Enterococcus sp. 9E7_DIV0242]OTP13611.1 amino acid ABC transporter amino acid-binding/permease [Enterococcus sp. 9E7_DIV0242]